MFDSDVVIGLEIHAEINTKSKLFCGCARTGSSIPNTRTCPVCLGHPGSKPVLNKEIIESALKLCFACNCEIAPELIFSRKSYFYPDMSKNYQITQYEEPIGKRGSISISNGKIRINRIHIEEDPAALVHPNGMNKSNYVLVDYNRSGDPLLEIVTEPDLKSPEEAREFMKRLISILNYLDIFDIDSCIIKADANISIKESGYVRSEIKNVTGFKEIEKALNYEILRQKKDISEGRKLVQDTRGWDGQITTRMRVKETEADYGYIFDPDLPIIKISDEIKDKARNKIPELPQDKVKRYVKEYSLNYEDGEVIAQTKEIAELFEESIKIISPVFAAKWIRKEVLRVLNYAKISFKNSKLNSQKIIEILSLISDKKITENVAKKILEKLMEDDFDIKDYIKKEGLEMISDSSEIEKFVQEVIEENPQAVLEFKEGKSKSLNFLIGQVMRKSKGKASPKEVNDLLLKKS